MDIKNIMLSAIKGMRRMGSGIEFDVVLIERNGNEVKEYLEKFYADGKFVASYLQEFTKVEKNHIQPEMTKKVAQA